MMVETNDDQRATSLTRLPSYPWRFAHLAALWAYGVSQPVFSMLKGNPEFLVVRGSSRLDVVVFALVLAFVPPLAVIAIEALAGVVSRALSALLHIGAVFGFAYLAALQLTRLLDIEGGSGALAPGRAGRARDGSLTAKSIALPLLFVPFVPCARRSRCSDSSPRFL